MLSASLPDFFHGSDDENNFTIKREERNKNSFSEDGEIRNKEKFVIGINALVYRFHYIFGHTSEIKGSQRRKYRRHYQTRVKAEPFDPFSWNLKYERRLDESDDQLYDYQDNVENEECTTYLVKFLEGTTDAHDTCEGIQNAYSSAECMDSHESYKDKYDIDDYFTEFSEYQCCQALMKHHSEYCEENSLLTNMHLLVSACVLLLCELAKATVNRAGLKFFPEAGVCILVGTVCGLFGELMYQLVPGDFKISDMSFDDELFLTVLLPPIIFEAALSVSKFEFKRRRGAIFMFSVFGTIISTFLSGFLVHFLSYLGPNRNLPMLDSLVFGALISSIDPVAILSVLTSLNMDQKDTIFILIFGESLLNDGISITVFQTLVDRFDGKTNDGTTSVDEVLGVLATFLIAMFGSIAVGLVSGVAAWGYFSYLENYLPPVMEVGSFFLWALIPYYICDGVGWSGIVSIVAVGFFMDIYIAGPKEAKHMTPTAEYGPSADYLHMTATDESFSLAVASADRSLGSVPPLQSTERIHLSAVANRHIRFVAHLTAQLSENAIFAYLGLFLFNGNYDWNPFLMICAVTSCIVSRLVMVVVVSSVIYRIYKCRKRTGEHSNSSRTAASIRDFRTQTVLVLAGLRGAVSLALVENVPIYNAYTGEGCEFKQVLKGMTSACILFTTFVFGGGAYYILPHLGIVPDRSKGSTMTPTSTSRKSRRSKNGPTNGVVC
eukprot:CAMPEP_0194130492 /NCGR_PEP_ID=MMETSP0152-20130528/1521_1 /TAXON_ID=1049557 /ORGANISM="Thalassiothrix antarctica, Strain L6-D1" /LENGTH=719 /DNA_ID=CAMNT_0038825031 /DNA_START=210 /DNA_END=2369 /DNA_ORIENTATION=-